MKRQTTGQRLQATGTAKAVGPQASTMKARRTTDNTRAVRAVVTLALEAKPCPCGDPKWRVTHVEGRVRYVRCTTCGRTDKMIPSTAG